MKDGRCGLRLDGVKGRLVGRMMWRMGGLIRGRGLEGTECTMTTIRQRHARLATNSLDGTADYCSSLAAPMYVHTDRLTAVLLSFPSCSSQTWVSLSVHSTNGRWSSFEHALTYLPVISSSTRCCLGPSSLRHMHSGATCGRKPSSATTGQSRKQRRASRRTAPLLHH